MDGGNTPNCVIKPSVSMMMRVSLIRPLLQAVDDHAPNPDLTTSGGNAHKLSLLGSGPFKAAGHFIAFGNLFLHGEVKIGKGRSHDANNVLQAVQSWALSRKRNLLDYVVPDEIRS